jgi:hypothetical protein
MNVGFRKRRLVAALSIIVIQFFIVSCGDGGDDSVPDSSSDNNTGVAIIGLTVIDGGDALSGGTPPPEPEGYTLLPIDLNEGTGGHYVWLYYKMGLADGSQGDPIGEIYTVAEYDGETPISEDDTKLSVNLNGEGNANPLWLYRSTSTGAVIRCIVVANETEGKTVYGPPEAAGKYNVIWVEELDPDSWKTPSGYPQPSDAQDLNEADSPIFPRWADWIFIGYCVDR